MTVLSIFRNLSFAISTFSLLSGYVLGGYGLLIAPVLFAMLIFWLFMNSRLGWVASSYLLSYTVLAAIGIVFNLSTIAMIIACTAALASWDLIQFERSLVGEVSQDESTILEKCHLQSLAWAAFTGLLLALLISMISLRIPFWGLIVLVLMAVCGIFIGIRFK